MDRRKLKSAALFITIFGVMLFTPPLTLLVQVETRLFGAPVELIYMFSVWAGLVAAAFWLGRRMPRDAGSDEAPD